MKEIHDCHWRNGIETAFSLERRLYKGGETLIGLSLKFQGKKLPEIFKK